MTKNMGQQGRWEIHEVNEFITLFTFPLVL
jgi:hypothetical protein